MTTTVENVRNFLREKEAHRVERIAALFEQASQDARRMIDHIILRHNNVKIYQWGSLLEKDDFDELSDIDIAIEELESSEDFFKLYGELDRISSLPLVKRDLAEFKSFLSQI